MTKTELIEKVKGIIINLEGKEAVSLCNAYLSRTGSKICITPLSALDGLNRSMYSPIEWLEIADSLDFNDKTGFVEFSEENITRIDIRAFYDDDVSIIDIDADVIDLVAQYIVEHKSSLGNAEVEKALNEYKPNRIKMVKAMEYIARQLNDEEVFECWLMCGVADGDINYGDLTEEDKEGFLSYYTEDAHFADLMQWFLNIMSGAKKSGGLYCDGVVSELEEV